MRCHRLGEKGIRWLLAAVLMSLPACGPADGRAPLVPVRGRVTLDGGAWPGTGILTFEPATPNAKEPRIGVASFDRRGVFLVVLNQDLREGLEPGQYKVTVECFETVSTNGEDASGATVSSKSVPESYRLAGSTPLTLVIDAQDGESEIALNVTTH